MHVIMYLDVRILTIYTIEAMLCGWYHIENFLNLKNIHFTFKFFF